MRAIEARLRESLADRASQVTEDTLVRHHADPARGVVPIGAGRDNRRNRVLVLVAAAVAFILAGFSWLVIVNRHGVPANPLPTVTSTVPSPSLTAPTTSDTSHVAGEYTREAIPWSVVGAGWSVALRVDESAPANTLLFVSPWGARYVVGRYAASSILDASLDGTHAMLSSATERTVILVDLTTGAAKSVAVAGTDAWAGGLVQPDGSGFFTLEQSSAATLTRCDSASLTPAWSVSTTIAAPQSSPDGRYIVGFGSPEARNVAIVDATNGAVVADVPTPAGVTSCTPENWWSDDEIVISCASSDSVADVWRYSLSTRTMTRISRGSASYIAAYPSSIGIVVHHTGGCNDVPIGILAGDGTTDTPIAAAGRTDAGELVTVIGTTAYLVYTGCNTDKGHAMIVTFDLVTHATVTLVDVNDLSYQGWITLR